MATVHVTICHIMYMTQPITCTYVQYILYMTFGYSVLLSNTYQDAIINYGCQFDSNQWWFPLSVVSYSYYDKNRTMELAKSILYK